MAIPTRRYPLTPALEERYGPLIHEISFDALEEVLGRFPGPRQPSGRDYVHVLPEPEVQSFWSADISNNEPIRYLTIFREDAPALARALYLARLSAAIANDESRWLPAAYNDDPVPGDYRRIASIPSSELAQMRREDWIRLCQLHVPVQGRGQELAEFIRRLFPQYCEPPPPVTEDPPDGIDYSQDIGQRTFYDEDHAAAAAVETTAWEDAGEEYPEVALEQKPSNESFEDFLKRSAAIIEECSR